MVVDSFMASVLTSERDTVVVVITSVTDSDTPSEEESVAADAVVVDELGKGSPTKLQYVYLIKLALKFYVWGIDCS